MFYLSLIIEHQLYRRESNMVQVAQCWDDGVVTDLRLTEILRKYGAKATFNLCPGHYGEKRVEPSWMVPGYIGWSHRGMHGGSFALSELVTVYRGFRIASHGMRHLSALEHSDEDFLKDAMDARKFLEDLFQIECPGYAWPYGRYTPLKAAALLEAGFEYGRTAEYTGCVESYENPMMLHSSCHFQDPFFYQKYENAKARGGIFYFWGHSYEMMDSQGMWKQLEDKIAFIADDSAARWIDVIDIVRKK